MMALWYRRGMRTVNLSDEAYQRLADWRRDDDEPISDVVLREVPIRGSAAAILRGLEELPPLTEEEFAAVQSYLADERDPAQWQDTWTGTSTPISSSDSGGRQNAA